MPRTSLKQLVSTEATQLLGVALLLDLCFNDTGNKSLEATSNLINTTATQILELDGLEVELLMAEVQELCEALLVALP